MAKIPPIAAVTITAQLLLYDGRDKTRRGITHPTHRLRANASKAFLVDQFANFTRPHCLRNVARFWITYCEFSLRPFVVGCYPFGSAHGDGCRSGGGVRRGGSISGALVGAISHVGGGACGDRRWLGGADRAICRPLSGGGDSCCAAAGSGFIQSGPAVSGRNSANGLRRLAAAVAADLGTIGFELSAGGVAAFLGWGNADRGQ
jgi:hypothetical protein